MAEFAYSLDNGLVVKDFELDAAYTNPKKGDFVVVTSGKLLKVVALTGATVTGLLEGIEFTGLVAQGQPYAATNASQTADAVSKKIGKVRVGKDVVYRIPAGTIVAATIGGVTGLDANGAGNIAATAKPYKVLDVKDGFAFVTIA